jgi:hypothetical protein
MIISDSPLMNQLLQAVGRNTSYSEALLFECLVMNANKTIEKDVDFLVDMKSIFEGKEYDRDAVQGHLEKLLNTTVSWLSPENGDENHLIETSIIAHYKLKDSQIYYSFSPMMRAELILGKSI